jgi:hypothetical protein
MLLRAVDTYCISKPGKAMPANQVGHLNPFALHFIKLEEALEINCKMSIDTKPAKPASSAFSFGIGVTSTIWGRTNEESSKLSGGVFHLARDPIPGPALPSLQLLGCLCWGSGVMMCAPVACCPEF